MLQVSVLTILRKSLLSGFTTGIQPEKSQQVQELWGGEREKANAKHTGCLGYICESQRGVRTYKYPRVSQPN